MAIHGRFARTNFHSGSDDSGDYKAGYEVGYDAGIQIGLETGPDVDFITAFTAGYETGVLAKPSCDAGPELVLGSADRPGGSYSAFGHGFEIGHIGADGEDDFDRTFNLGYAEGYRAGIIDGCNYDHDAEDD